jgi:hypothetical protein
MKYLLFINLCLFATCLLAQQPQRGVVLHKDSRIDALLKKQADINKVAAQKNSRGQYKGYRVLALNTNDRDLALKTKAQLLSRFPDYKVYLSYQTPFFRLKIGDFIKRNDAEELRKRITVMMTKGVYIVPDIVTLTSEDEERLINEND